MWHLIGIFVSDTHFGIMYEETVAVDCILVDMCKHVGSICLCSIMAV